MSMSQCLFLSKILNTIFSILKSVHRFSTLKIELSVFSTWNARAIILHVIYGICISVVKFCVQNSVNTILKYFYFPCVNLIKDFPTYNTEFFILHMKIWMGILLYEIGKSLYFTYESQETDFPP